MYYWVHLNKKVRCTSASGVKSYSRALLTIFYPGRGKGIKLQTCLHVLPLASHLQIIYSWIFFIPKNVRLITDTTPKVKVTQLRYTG